MSTDPILAFPDAKTWSAWLATHHRHTKGVWLRLAKKGTDMASVSYSDALDVALCHGWIDGQRRSEGTDTWLIRFTVRGARSIWSTLNRQRIEKLEASGHMTPAGRAAVEQAKADGRWNSAYEGQRTIAVPPDFIKALARHKKARTMFESLDSANRYAILFRLHHAKKAESRAKKISEYVAMLERGETFHPKRARAKRPARG